MIVSKAVISAVFLIATLSNVSGKPQSSVIRERHIIHAPIKFRVIHHYKIKKVPIIIKKHLHYHKPPHTEKTKPTLEEIHANYLYRDGGHGNSPHSDFHPQDDSKQYPSHPGIHLEDDSEGSVPDSGFHPQDDGKGFAFHVDFQPRDHRYEAPGRSPHQNDHDSQEEDYEDSQESQEDYEVSEYE